MSEMKRQVASPTVSQAHAGGLPSPSLRQRARLLGRDAILDAASQLFLTRGYRATTMSTLADAAGVGVATVFRYFKSKEGVLAALSRRDIDAVKERARKAITPLPLEPAEGFVRLFTAVFEMHRMPSTQIRGQTRLWLLIPTGHTETDQVVTSSDRELQETIRDMLVHYRNSKRIPKRHSVEDMITVIFAVFYHQYLRLALDRSLPTEAVIGDLSRQIRLLFKSWEMSAT